MGTGGSVRNKEENCDGFAEFCKVPWFLVTLHDDRNELVSLSHYLGGSQEGVTGSDIHATFKLRLVFLVGG